MNKKNILNIIAFCAVFYSCNTFCMEQQDREKYLESFYQQKDQLDEAITLVKKARKRKPELFITKEECEELSDFESELKKKKIDLLTMSWDDLQEIRRQIVKNELTEKFKFLHEQISQAIIEKQIIHRWENYDLNSIKIDLKKIPKNKKAIRLSKIMKQIIIKDTKKVNKANEEIKRCIENGVVKKEEDVKKIITEITEMIQNQEYKKMYLRGKYSYNKTMDDDIRHRKNVFENTFSENMIEYAPETISCVFLGLGSKSSELTIAANILLGGKKISAIHLISKKSDKYKNENKTISDLIDILREVHGFYIEETNNIYFYINIAQIKQFTKFLDTISEQKHNTTIDLYLHKTIDDYLEYRKNNQLPKANILTIINLQEDINLGIYIKELCEDKIFWGILSSNRKEDLRETLKTYIKKGTYVEM